MMSGQQHTAAALYRRGLRQQDDECLSAHRSSTLPVCVLDSKMMSGQQHTPAALYRRVP